MLQAALLEEYCAALEPLRVRFRCLLGIYCELRRGSKQKQGHLLDCVKVEPLVNKIDCPNCNTYHPSFSTLVTSTVHISQSWRYQEKTETAETHLYPT